MQAAVLNSWREAASLILVTCRKRILHPVMGEKPPSPNPSNMELELMLMKRTRRSSTIMPHTYVFPGGAADDADFSPNWLPIFGEPSSQCAVSRFDFTKSVEAMPFMFTRTRCPEFSEIPSEIAFRLCAIRKTFEETGVLMVRSADQTNFNYSAHTAYPYKFGDGPKEQEALQNWRKKIIENPYDFLSLCRSLEVVPDVWSLYTWSNWLTPTSPTPHAKRFDTAFFICCLEQHPKAQVLEGEPCSPEILDLQWSSPRQMLYDYMENRAQVAPPELYEASRLIKFNTVAQLMDFLKFRSDQPVERCMPVTIHCADGTVFTFPGDTLYPDCPKIEGEEPEIHMKDTIEEMNCKSPNLHRFILHKSLTECGMPQCGRHFQLRCGIDLRFKHITPTDYRV